MRKERAQGKHVQNGNLAHLRPKPTLEGEQALGIYKTIRGDWDQLPYALAVYTPSDIDLLIKLLFELQAAREASIEDA